LRSLRTVEIDAWEHFNAISMRPQKAHFSYKKIDFLPNPPGGWGGVSEI